MRLNDSACGVVLSFLCMIGFVGSLLLGFSNFALAQDATPGAAAATTVNTPSPTATPPDKPSESGPSATPVPAIGKVPPIKQKTVWVAHVLRRKSAQNVITSLEIEEKNLPVFLISRTDELQPTITVNGTFNKPNAKLFAQGTELDVDPETHEFEVTMRLRGRLNECKLTAITPDGKKEVETIYIYAPEAMQFQVVSPWDRLVISAGGTFLSYRQSGYGEYQSIGAKLGVRYTSPERKSRWGVYGNLDATVFTFASSPTARGPQLVEAKADATYKIGSKEDPWQKQIVGGLSYITMFSNGSSFGFANLAAPEFGIRARKVVSPTKAWIFDAHYVALGIPKGFDNFGLNLGLTWSKFIRDSRRIEFGINYSGYYYPPADDQTIRLNEFTVRTGISF